MNFVKIVSSIKESPEDSIQKIRNNFSKNTIL
jgi:hypothetical protein